MKNSRITLQEYLDKYGCLQKGMIAKTTLIDELEIYGFINCSEEMFDEFQYNRYALLGIVNKDSSNQIIQSNYMYQIIEWFDDGKVKKRGLNTPIYAKLQKSDIDTEINIEELYIPDLINHKLYKYIHTRDGKGVEVTEKMVNWNKPAKGTRNIWEEYNITIKDGKAFMPIHKGDILCQHIMDGSTKSIGKKLLAVCRYIHNMTGRMYYTQLELDELIVKDEVYDVL